MISIIEIKRICNLAWLEFRKNIFSLRMCVLFPLLLLFILGAAWGFSDSNAKLPSNIVVNSPFDVLFLTSLFVLFTATLGVVLIGFDSISHKRLSGTLAIELSQPIPRWHLAISNLIGVWITIALPTTLITITAILIIHHQMNEWVSISELLMFIFASCMVIYWYTSLQLLASSLAKDMGSAVTLGVGTWLLFTMVWLLVTIVLASLFGVDATNMSNVEFEKFGAKVDLFSPNGVYQLLLEIMLESDSLSRPIEKIWVWLATIAWTVIPTGLFVWKFNHLKA